MSNDHEDDAREFACALLEEVDLAPPRERLALAIQAIRAAPSLSDSYSAAAAAMRQSSPEALAAWLAAREITRRDAGDRIESDAGRLGDNLYARPYLRACVGYALCALENGEHDEALAQLRQVLALDVDDRIGARYALATALLIAGRFEDFTALRTTQTEDTTAFWLYADAYHALAAKAPITDRKTRLARALASNAHAPLLFALDEQQLGEPADSFAPGGFEEARALACSLTGRLWRRDHVALQALLKASRSSQQK